MLYHLSTFKGKERYSTSTTVHYIIFGHREFLSNSKALLPALYLKENIMQVPNCEKLIDLFHKAVRTTEDSARVDFSELNSKAVRLGYVIHPDCCNRMVEKWLETLTENHNATFYKEWKDVLEKDRFELFLDQIRHYATTYGTDFSLGNGYVPNDGSVVPDFKKLKVVEPVSVEEMFGKCYGLVRKGIALGKNTIEAVCDFMVSILRSGKYQHVQFDVNLVSSKEAQAYLCYKLGIFPRDEFGMLRYLVYWYSGSTAIIKNRDTFDLIRRSASRYSSDSPLLRISPSEKRSLSRIFLRYKPIFLAMKTKETAKVVNEISRLSRTNHVPASPGFWETLVQVPKPEEEILERLPSLDVFRKIRLLQAVRIALLSPEKDKFYLVRNGKGFLRKGYSPRYDSGYLGRLETLLENSIVDSLRKKACKVKLPKHFDLALPSSEKSFVGNLPFGTEIRLQRHNMFGIYWRNEWGAMDIDLSMTDLNGTTISWIGDLMSKDDSVIHSGDMTNADPEASEILYCSGKVPDGIVQANLYCGSETSRFRFFVATEEIDPRNLKLNHMVDPNNVRMDVTAGFEPGKRQLSLGFVKDGSFVLAGFSLGRGRVAQSTDYVLRTIDVMTSRSRLVPKLRDILLKSGFEIVEEGADLDLSDPTKDDLINLLKD